MRILDADDRELVSPDLTIGHLVDETIEHEAVESVDEMGHWETVAEYDNGGKDVRWAVDVQGVIGHEAYTEDIQRYVPYTSAELRVMELRSLLASTDYIACKLAEGAATAEEYADEIALRQAWREEINDLEEA